MSVRLGGRLGFGNWAAMAIAVAIAGIATSAPAASSSAAGTALLRAEDELFAADVRHDVVAIELGFADEAIFVHANGAIQTKADYIEAMRNPKFPVSAIETEGRVVRIFGNLGVVRGIKKITVGDLHLSGSYLTVYVKRHGRWQMLDEQSAPSPKSPEL